MIGKSMEYVQIRFMVARGRRDLDRKKDSDKTTEINVGYFNNVTHAQALYRGRSISKE